MGVSFITQEMMWTYVCEKLTDAFISRFLKDVSNKRYLLGDIKK